MGTLRSLGPMRDRAVIQDSLVLPELRLFPDRARLLITHEDRASSVCSSFYCLLPAADYSRDTAHRISHISIIGGNGRRVA